jgi:tRNA threonylcarbamoyladenosine dehydratase
MACRVIPYRVNEKSIIILRLLLAFIVGARSTVSWMIPPSQHDVLIPVLIHDRQPGIMVILPRKRHGRVVQTSLSLQARMEDQTAIVDEIQQQQHHSATNQTEKNSVDEEAWDLRFASVGRLYGGSSSSMDDAVESSSTDNDNDADQSIIIQRLREFTVVVIGLGGVGSWAAEALCRSGVGNLILIDLDDICISNTNRQLHAMSSTVGQLKIEQMQRRLLDINPDCNVSLIHDFVSVDNVHEILNDCCNVVTTTRGIPTSAAAKSFNITTSLIILDCIDRAAEKSALIAACTDRHIPIVTCGGAAGKRDPTRVVCEDLARLSGDKLLAWCRLTLRKSYHFPTGLPFDLRQKRRRPVKKWYISAIYSPEIPANTDESPLTRQRTSSLRRCDGSLGTACFVTGSFGFLAAARCVDMITGALPLRAPKRR